MLELDYVRERARKDIEREREREGEERERERYVYRYGSFPELGVPFWGPYKKDCGI